MSPTNRGSPDVTAVIAAHDESANIEACIASVEWAAEVIVVENDSSDDTDERCTPELAAEISRVISAAGDSSAFRVPRRNYFLGKEIRHGGWGSDKPVRLFRRDLRYNDNLVHEHVNVTNGAVGEVNNSLLHYTYTSLNQYFEKFDRYSRWWAEQNFAKGRRRSAAAVCFNPPARFAGMYILRAVFEMALADSSSPASRPRVSWPNTLDSEKDRSAMKAEVEGGRH